MKKVFYVHDFITSTAFQYKTVDFLEPIFSHFKNIDLFIAKEENFNFSREYLFSTLCNKKIEDNFIENINYEDLTKEAIKYILSFVKNYDFIIVYEASSTLKKVFEKNDIKYLDIWLSPIRFYDDLMFCFYSNDKKIANKLSKYKFKESKIKRKATELVSHIKLFKNFSYEIKNNSALVIGQLAFDKSVMKKDKFLTLLDFKKNIEEMAKTHEILYFQKHPLMPKEEFQLLFKAFSYIKNIVYLDNINTYYLLSREEIQTVIGISSSVLKEAKYFDKQVMYLYKPVISTKYITIYKEYYKSSFWSNLLEVKSETKYKYLAHDNYLRQGRFSPYSYDEFMDDNLPHRLTRFLQKSENNYHHYGIIIQFYNFIQSLDKNKKYVLYGYGSVGKLILPHIKDNVEFIIDKSLEVKYVEGIEVISIESLNKDMNVIISAFKYNEEISNILAKSNCKVYIYKEREKNANIKK